MTRRLMLVLWSATAAAVFLLGGTVATLKAVLAGGSRINLVLLALSLGGLLGSLGVAGRIVVVVGRSSGPNAPHRPPVTHGRDLRGLAVELAPADLDETLSIGRLEA